MSVYQWLTLCLFIPTVALCGELETQTNNKVNVPADLQHAKIFVQSLANQGLVIHSVRPSKWNGFFTRTTNAAWIETDKGIVEIVVFDNATEAQEVQITQGEVPNGMFSYTIKGSQSDSPKVVKANKPLYFRIQNNLFIKTDERVLDTLIKRLHSEK